MKNVSFDVTKKDAKKLHAIAKRAVELARKLGVKISTLEMDMDLTACHANGNPLNLDKLLAADDDDLLHDAFGTRRHINRRTGKLADCFVPRCSRK